ncbi:MAG: hypothetical protein L0221_02495 [Chloroflexi bacterium]|nr:hypothetical protein [Chloroflexota bacterium]
MDLETHSGRSRRSLLAAAFGAAAATVATAFRNVPRTSAADGDPVIAGQTVTSNSMTRIQSTANLVPAFAVETLTGNAVSGVSVTSAGVSGYSTDSVGVVGVSNSTKAGVVGGSSSSQSGVIGFSGPGSISAYPAETGVHGYSAVSGASRGVFGQSTSGVGVRGEATTGTGLEATSNSGTGLIATSATGLGLSAGSGGPFPGPIVPNTGVYGYSTDGMGIYGASDTGTAIYAATHGSAAIIAQGNGGTGVMGYTDPANPPPAPPKVGVYGHGTQDSAARGVFGRANAGTGVHGYAGSGTVPVPASKTGVYGRCDIDASARGVSGFSGPGAAVYGGTTIGKALHGIATDPTGLALKTSGRVTFGKVSGVATLAASAMSVVATPGTDIASGAFVLLTPQGDPGSRRLWATIDTTANTITIRASASGASSLKIAWLALG